MVGSGPHSREPRAWFRAAGMLFGGSVIIRFTARHANHTHARGGPGGGGGPGGRSLDPQMPPAPPAPAAPRRAAPRAGLGGGRGAGAGRTVPTPETAAARRLRGARRARSTLGARGGEGAVHARAALICGRERSSSPRVSERTIRYLFLYMLPLQGYQALNCTPRGDGTALWACTRSGDREHTRIPAAELIVGLVSAESKVAHESDAVYLYVRSVAAARGNHGAGGRGARRTNRMYSRSDGTLYTSTPLGNLSLASAVESSGSTCTHTGCVVVCIWATPRCKWECIL